MIHHELKEQKKVVTFLKQQMAYGRVIKFTSVPNSTYTPYMSEINRITASGLNPGFPDLIIVLSDPYMLSSPHRLVCLEMKRPGRLLKNGMIGKTPSSTSSEQIEWHTILNQCVGVVAVICEGADEAIRFLTSQIGDISAPKETNEETNRRVDDFHQFITGKA